MNAKQESLTIPSRSNIGERLGRIVEYRHGNSEFYLTGAFRKGVEFGLLWWLFSIGFLYAANHAFILSSKIQGLEPFINRWSSVNGMILAGGLGALFCFLYRNVQGLIEAISWTVTDRHPMENEWRTGTMPQAPAWVFVDKDVQEIREKIIALKLDPSLQAYYLQAMDQWLKEQGCEVAIFALLREAQRRAEN